MVCQRTSRWHGKCIAVWQGLVSGSAASKSACKSGSPAMDMDGRRTGLIWNETHG